MLGLTCDGLVSYQGEAKGTDPVNTTETGDKCMCNLMIRVFPHLLPPSWPQQQQISTGLFFLHVIIIIEVFNYFIKI